MPLSRRTLLAWGTAGAATGHRATAAPAKALLADVIDIAPWGRKNTDGTVGGVYAEVFKRLGQISGCKIELRLVPISRAVAEVSSGMAQITMMLERDDLNRAGVSLGTVTTLEIEVWLPKGSTVRSLDQLAGQTVATLRGPAYHEEFDTNNRILKYPVTNARQQLEMMRKGRLDGALGVRQNFLVAMRELGWGNEDFAAPLWLGSRRVQMWVTAAMRDAPCTSALSDALASMRRSGEIDRLLSQSVYAPAATPAAPGLKR